MKPVFKEFVDGGEIEAPKSGWTPIKQQTLIEDFNKDKKYSFKTLKEVLVEGGFVEEKPKEVIEENIESVLTAYKELFVETVQAPEPEPVVQQVIIEEVVVEPKVEESKPVSLVGAASDYITRRVKIEEADSFQQPVAPNTPNNLTDINKRVRYLEQWLAKVSMAGPGGGAGDVINLDHPVKLITNNYTVTKRDYYIGVNSTNTVTITLPDSIGFAGRMVIIKDESGNCESNPITVSGTVDNDPGGFILSQNNGGIQMIYREGWRIV